MSIEVSVVVPTCQRPELLNRCLAALVRQQFDPDIFEIIVVDDSPSADTRQRVQSSAARTRGHGPVIRYLANTATRGPAAARNRGWQAACGNIIAFTDDDTIPAPGWLRSGSKALENGAVAAWGRIIMPIPDPPTDYERDAAGLEHAEFVTANCFVRKSVLEAIGGFDEHFEIAWREDADLFFRLLEHDPPGIDYVPHAVVVHPVRPAPWGISIRQQRKVLFDALLYKKHPSLYRRRIRPTPPWRYYAIAAMLLVSPSAALAGQWGLSIAASLVWIALTGSFTLERLRHTSHAPTRIVEMVVTSAVIPILSVFWRVVGAVKFRVFFV
jgi:GT2 family glycosyltransferase